MTDTGEWMLQRTGPPLGYRMVCTSCGDRSWQTQTTAPAADWAGRHAADRPGHDEFVREVLTHWRATPPDT